MTNNETMVIEAPSFENSSVTSALSRVRSCLNYALRNQYGIDNPEITEKFLKMHGLSKQHFDFISNFENLIEKGIADGSVDTNANKGETSVTGLLSEVSQPINKLVGYRYLYRKMKELYGKQRAKFLAGEMYDMSLALADSTNVLKIYCYSLNASKLVFEGKPWGALFSAPPKRIMSYVTQLSELIHQLSSHVAGALAVGSFFMDLAHVYIYREQGTLSQLREDSKFRKYAENCIQSFIHSMNHLSRNGVESPFTNISIFDKPKLRSLLDADNMAWYFEKEDPIDGTPLNALTECADNDWMEYVIDIISEFQEIYMSIMDRGDPLHNGKPITFPVSTLNISRRENRLGNYEFEDRSFVDYVCKHHDIMRYNIYISSGAKVASCCLKDSQLISFYDENNILTLDKIGDYVESKLPEGKTDYKFEEKDFKEKVLDPITGKLEYITGVRKLKNEYRKIIHIELEDGTILDVTPNHKIYDKKSKTLVTAEKILENPEDYDI